VPLLHGLVFHARIAPIAVHYKANMSGYWSGGEDAEKEVARGGGDLVLEPG